MNTAKINGQTVAQIVNHKFTVPSGEGQTRNSINIEAANINRFGKVQLLVRKDADSPNESLQWIGLDTFNFWLQMNAGKVEID